MTTTTTTTPASHRLPMIIDEVEVVAVSRMSPTFVRVELGGAALADFGVDGPLYDQRIKLVFPNDAGKLPSFVGADESWFTTWLEIPVEQRGHIRTYTVRDVRGSGTDTRLVVDFVLHLEPGATGPASSWAAHAKVGDRLITVAPRRGEPFGGIEFRPPEDVRVLLVGDETAVPAVSSILEDLPDGTDGVAVLEVPTSGDVLNIRCPLGMEVIWIPRNGSPLGTRLHEAVLARLGQPSLSAVEEPDDVDPDLWETPTYSSSGEMLDAVEEAEGRGLDGWYAWIAGESGVVTGLRRHLVKELGMDRRQVAFMGYWRRGVAMRS
jgi:NADPH-dependent ferric siderophore reductase